VQIYDELRTNYAKALDDIHTLSEQERSAQNLLMKLKMLSKKQAAILKDKLKQRMKSKDTLLKDMLQAMKRQENDLREALSEEDLLRRIETPRVKEMFDGALEEERQRTAAFEKSVRAVRDEGTDVDELILKFENLQSNVRSLQAENDILREHCEYLGSKDASKFARLKKEIMEHEKKLSSIKNEQESLERERRHAQEATAAAVASTAKHTATQQVQNGEGKGSAAETQEERGGVVEEESAAALYLKDISSLGQKCEEAEKQVNVLKVEKQGLLDILAEAQAELIRVGKEAKEAKKSGVASEEVSKQLKESQQMCKEAEEKASRANDEKRSKIRKMQAMLETAQKQVSEEEDKVDALKEMLERERERHGRHVAELERHHSELLETKVKERVEDAKAEAQAQMESMKKKVEEMQAVLKAEITQRRKLHNKVMEFEGNIRVYCRLRPPNKIELKANDGQGEIVTQADDATGIVSVNACIQGATTRNVNSKFEFDSGFAPTTPQLDVFDRVSPFVTSAMDGYNCCIFAYGQTGSGKTHTMQGPTSDRGVNVRALYKMFSEAQLRRDNFGIEFSFRLSMCEIYKEEVYDLLGEQGENGIRQSMKLRQGEKNLVYAEGLTLIPVDDAESVEAIVQLGQKNRSVGSHNFNEHSSRSHLVVTVHITAWSKASESSSDKPKKKRQSQLNLIDLAGSERLEKTGASGERLKEAQAINKSLSALGDVIGALGRGGKHVPYRNSKLTWLLSSSLNGRSKVLMLVCISPTLMCTPETLCSLQFAQRCRATSLGRAKKNAAE
jgi:kinesin family protein C2/C3